MTGVCPGGEEAGAYPRPARPPAPPAGARGRIWARVAAGKRKYQGQGGGQSPRGKKVPPEGNSIIPDQQPRFRNFPITPSSRSR